MYVCLNSATIDRHLPLEQFVQLAADAGYAGADVDLAYGVEHGAARLRDLYASRNLRFGGWGPPDWRGDDAAGLAPELKPFERKAREARDLNIDSCCTWIMSSSKRPFIENWNFHVERLKPIARVLADNGLRFGLEFIGPHHLRRQHSHEFIFSPGLMLELANAVGPNVGLLIDSFHVYTSGMTWEHLSQLPSEKIIHGHINDAPRLPLAEVKDGERLSPGEGAIDLRAFISSLRAAGYVGPLSLEIFNAGFRNRPADEVAHLTADATRRALGGMTFD